MWTRDRRIRGIRTANPPQKLPHPTILRHIRSIVKFNKPHIDAGGGDGALLESSV